VKLRIRDNSFRFRITLEELEKLRAEAKVEVSSMAGLPEQGHHPFGYRLCVDASTEACSHLMVEPYSISLVLSQSDFETLSQPDKEGIYIRHEWTGAGGGGQRSMITVEKDRPASSCDKPDEWIYHEGHGGSPSTVRPIPKSTAGPGGRDRSSH
jgi:hypothetical protein